MAVSGIVSIDALCYLTAHSSPFLLSLPQTIIPDRHMVGISISHFSPQLCREICVFRIVHNSLSGFRNPGTLWAMGDLKAVVSIFQMFFFLPFYQFSFKRERRNLSKP